MSVLVAGRTRVTVCGSSRPGTPLTRTTPAAGRPTTGTTRTAARVALSPRRLAATPSAHPQGHSGRGPGVVFQRPPVVLGHLHPGTRGLGARALPVLVRVLADRLLHQPVCGGGRGEGAQHHLAAHVHHVVG